MCKTSVTTFVKPNGIAEKGTPQEQSVITVYRQVYYPDMQMMARSRNPASAGHNSLSLARGYSILAVWKRLS